VQSPSDEVVLGQTLQLTAIPKTQGGVPLPARDVAWSSSDESTATVNSSGVVTGTSIGGPVQIRATVEGVTGETQIRVLPVPVDHIIVTPPDNDIQVGQQTQLTATAYDAGGAVLSGRTFFWASDATSVAGITTTGLVIGIATGGPVTITATADGKTGSATVSVTRRPATRLGFSQPPGQAIAAIAVTPAVQVVVQDDLLGTVTGATNQVTIALAGNPGGATLSGTLTVAAVNGVATFANLILDRAGSGYTLMASAQGLASAISPPFTVVAGAANKLAMVTPPPGTAQSGVGFGIHPVVQIVDAAGNPVSQSGILVTASIASGNGTLGGTLAVATNASGAATFTNLALTGPAGPFTIAFSAPSIAPVTSGTILLSAGPPAALLVTTQPSGSARSGVVLARQPVVQVVDGTGNPVLQSGITVTASIASGPAGGTLGGSLTASTNGAGVATFAGLVLTGPAGSYVLGFGSAGVASVTSTPIALTAGTGTGLAVTTQPSATGTSGVAFSQQPVIQIQDAAGNPVGQSGTTITASLVSGPPGGVLGGTLVATTGAGGAAAFGNLSVAGPAGAYTIGFAAAGLSSAQANPVTLAASGTPGLAITVQPSSAAVNGVVLNQQPVVQLVDGSGQPSNQAGVAVTATLSGGGSATLGGTATVNSDGSGKATFAGLSITGKVGSYTLAFSASGMTGVTSGAIALGAGPAALLVISTQPSATATTGTAFALQPVLQVQDGSGNPVSGVVVTAAIASGSGTLGGTATATSDGSGTATFAGLSISGPTGQYTLGFTTPGAPQVTSASITLGAGAPTQLTIATQPSATAQSGVAFAQQPAVQVADALGNPVSGVLVTVAIGTGGGTLGGTATATSDASGLAVFSGLSISGTIGDYTLAFSASGTPTVTSNTITLAAGLVAQIVIVRQPSGSANHGAVFARQPIVQLTDAAGNLVAGASVTAAINSAILGNGVLGGTLTIVTDAAGLATFTNLKISKSGIYTLKFTSGGVTSPASSSITIT
jgi:hypothetical protein